MLICSKIPNLLVAPPTPKPSFPQLLEGPSIPSPTSVAASQVLRASPRSPYLLPGPGAWAEARQAAPAAPTAAWRASRGVGRLEWPSG